MAYLLGGLSGWTAVAARTHRRYRRAGYLGWPLVAVGKFWLEQLMHLDLPIAVAERSKVRTSRGIPRHMEVRRPSDDALWLVASYRMPAERSKSMGMTPRLPCPWQDSNLQPAV
jgi:hypothetical protein